MLQQVSKHADACECQYGTIIISMSGTIDAGESTMLTSLEC